MKHYKELTDIETVSINLDVLTSTVRVLTYGAPNSNRNDVEYSLHNITDQLEALNARLRETFDVLFNAVKEEGGKKDEAKPKSKQDKV
jgi:hypothetical protein